MNIDEEIRKSLEVDNDEVQLARLEQYWYVRLRRQLRRSRILRALPLAAAALITFVSLVAFWNRADDTKTLRVVQESSRSEAAALEDSKQFRHEETSSNGIYAGRTPTAYERFVFAVRTGRRPTQTNVAEQVENIIERLALSSQSDIHQLLDQANLDPTNAEPVLLRKLSRTDVANQDIILQLLSVCGTSQALPALIRLSKQDVIRDEVFTTMERIAGLDGLVRVAVTSNDPELLAALSLKLLNADSDSALLAYLSLVQNAVTRSVALRIAEATTELPGDRLLEFLSHKDKETRFSAAVVLGHVNGPAITERLIKLVTQNPGDSSEAWMALLACRGELAEEFFQYAERSPRLLGHVNNARLRWAQLFL